MAETKMISLRLPIEMVDDLDRAAERLGISRTTFVSEAVIWALEREIEAAETPLAVQQAIPKVRNGRMILPRGRIMPDHAGGNVRY